MLTQEQIRESHATGFGGSDAALIIRAGLNPVQLSISDTRRIRQAFGLEPLGDDVYTPAMAKGHDFERWYGEFAEVEGFKPEQLLQADFGTTFKTFAHADFYKAETGTVVECKCTQDDDFEAVQKRYYAQLQWYYLLGAKHVVLAWHPSTTFDFSDEFCFAEEVERNEDAIKMLRLGLRNIEMLRDRWFEGLPVAKAEEFEEGTPALIEGLTAAVKELKATEAKIEDFKARLKAAMEKAGVLKIEGDAVTITYVGESTARTFDKKALQKAMPDLDLTQFEKESKRSAYIKIETK